MVLLNVYTTCIIWAVSIRARLRQRWQVSQRSQQLRSRMTGFRRITSRNNGHVYTTNPQRLCTMSWEEHACTLRLVHVKLQNPAPPSNVTPELVIIDVSYHRAQL